MEIKISVPDGKLGPWEVSTFTVTDEEARFENLRAAFSLSSRPIDPGTYKKLTRHGRVVMSNTPAEIQDHLYFIYKAKKAGGDILINGLGLGVALSAILECDTVSSVTVVELSQEVISLVGPTYTQDSRVCIIHADALCWKPPKGAKYSAVWHDIWDDICVDNLPEMHTLHRKYGRRADWQGSWCRWLCERNR